MAIVSEAPLEGDSYEIVAAADDDFVPFSFPFFPLTCFPILFKSTSRLVHLRCVFFSCVVRIPERAIYSITNVYCCGLPDARLERPWWSN